MQTRIVWRNIWLWPLLPLLVPAAMVAGLLARPANRKPDDVARYLLNALESDEIGRDWDDFTSVPIADPALEQIRVTAEMVPLPLTSEGVAVLRGLYSQAKALVSAQNTAP